MTCRERVRSIPHARLHLACTRLHHYYIEAANTNVFTQNPTKTFVQISNLFDRNGKTKSMQRSSSTELAEVNSLRPQICTRHTHISACLSNTSTTVRHNLSGAPILAQMRRKTNANCAVALWEMCMRMPAPSTNAPPTESQEAFTSSLRPPSSRLLLRQLLPCPWRPVLSSWLPRWASWLRRCRRHR